MVDMNGSSIGGDFETFFNGWLSRQENFLQQLVQAPLGSQVELESLIQDVLSHYEHYLEEKSRAAKEQVLLFYSPQWLTYFEKTLLWVGGFKPLLLFKLLSNLATELTPEQEATIERVKHETWRQERELTESMATIQENMATPSLSILVKRFGRLIDGKVLELESAMEMLKVTMLRTLEKADKLRSSTVRKLTEVLSPVQTVKFQAAFVSFSSE